MTAYSTAVGPSSFFTNRIRLDAKDFNTESPLKGRATVINKRWGMMYLKSRRTRRQNH
jgi:hypothetical protein